MKDAQEAHPNKALEVWFQDEARVGQQGRLTRIWGEKGKRIPIPKDMRFESTYIYGAICPQRETGEAIIINKACKQAMEAHLQVVSRSIPPDRHALMVMDRAPWHRSLQVPDNITLVQLPPYSPELNPQEKIWLYLKNNFLSNTIFETERDIVQACCHAWNQLTLEPETIKSIGTRKWATIN